MRIVGLLLLLLSFDVSALKLRIPPSTPPVENELPSGWVDTLIDGGVRTIVSSSLSYETSTTRFTITHTGGEIWSTSDHARMATYAIGSLGDVTITSCVIQSHTGTAGSFPKAGVMIRETTGATSTNVFANILGVDGAQGYNLSTRATTSATTTKTDYTSPSVTLPWAVRLEVDGALESFKAYYSTDCDTPSWVEYDSGTASWLGTGDAVQIALGATVNDDGDVGWSGTAIFTNVVVDTSSVDHSAASIVDVTDPGPIDVDEDVAGGNAVFSMTRSGSGSGALTVTYSTADDTCVAGTHYTAVTDATLNWNDAEVGVKTGNIAVTNIAGVQGAASCLFDVTGAITAGSDTLTDDTQTFRWIDTDQSPPQTGSWTTQGDDGCVAFIPGMRGHGACTPGGFVAGTTVIVVSNLNASGSGSLDAANEASCPKVILFGVAGLINRAGQFTAGSCDNFSIVGASSPGQVSVTGAVSNPLFATQTSNDWTIDHLTLAAGDLDIQSGGSMGNRDSVAIGTGGATSGNGIFLNNNLIWGADETVQCNPPTGSEADNVLYWQNIIGKPVNGSGVQILQNSCRNQASIRNFYIHANGRHPLVRGDGYFHANNFTANPGYETINMQTCGGSASTPDDPTRMQFIGNLMARGQNSSSHPHIELKDGEACTTIQVYEDDTHTINASFSIENCANHACFSGFSSFETSTISAVYPTGYVAEAITNTQQGYIDFATQVTAFAGANPTNRLTFFSTAVSEGINHVDGAGDRGGWGSPSFPAGQPLDGTTTQGGISVITPTTITGYDPTSAAENPCAENMPTGGTADAITTSGRTRLHEWVIGCFYDNVMPGGYREDTLQYYAAP